jgi:hypothetical protein
MTSPKKRNHRSLPTALSHQARPRALSFAATTTAASTSDSTGPTILIFHSRYLARQAAHALTTPATASMSASATWTSQILCLLATDLNAHAHDLHLPANATLAFVVRAMAPSPANAFGVEGQYGTNIAELARNHAAQAGKHRVVAVLVAPSDNERIVPVGTSAKAFADMWKRTVRWPYDAVATLVPTLRRLSSEAEVGAALSSLHKLTMLSCDIPNLTVIEKAEDVVSTSEWSVMMLTRAIDIASLRVRDDDDEDDDDDDRDDGDDATVSLVANAAQSENTGKLCLSRTKITSSNSSDDSNMSSSYDFSVNAWCDESMQWISIAQLRSPAKKSVVLELKSKVPESTMTFTKRLHFDVSNGALISTWKKS